jgi:predicted nucleic acid-binding protein
MPVINIADPDCPLPDVLILDASMLLELPAAPQHRTRDPRQAVRRFLDRLGAEAIAGRMLCVAPAITLEECYFKVIQYLYAIEAQRRSPPVPWHRLYKSTPQLIQSYMPVLRRFREAVFGIPVVAIEPEDLGDPPPALEPRMFHHIEHVPILPRDAYLLAVAERLKTPHIATLDADFRAASEDFHIYTVIP